MRVVPVPCLTDNYAYLVICPATGTAAVVDPSDAPPVVEAAAREAVTLTAIWNTHHHPDHVGGNEALVRRLPGLEVVGHASDRGRIPGQTRFVAEGDAVTLGEFTARVIHNPGHTRGAVSYHLAGPAALFTGDTLFGAGCGRLFEGSPAEMHDSLGKLAVLPGDTRVYCGHEYTEKNLAFAAAVEPDSPAIVERRKAVRVARAAGRPTVPFTILGELATNPFLRCHLPEVVRAARAREAADGSVEVFAVLRRWKDTFS